MICLCISFFPNCLTSDTTRNSLKMNNPEAVSSPALTEYHTRLATDSSGALTQVMTTVRLANAHTTATGANSWQTTRNQPSVTTTTGNNSTTATCSSASTTLSPPGFANIRTSGMPHAQVANRFPPMQSKAQSFLPAVHAMQNRAQNWATNLTAQLNSSVLTHNKATFTAATSTKPPTTSFSSQPQPSSHYFTSNSSQVQSGSTTPADTRRSSVSASELALRPRPSSAQTADENDAGSDPFDHDVPEMQTLFEDFNFAVTPPPRAVQPLVEAANPLSEPVFTASCSTQPTHGWPSTAGDWPEGTYFQLPELPRLSLFIESRTSWMIPCASMQPFATSQAR